MWLTPFLFITSKRTHMALVSSYLFLPSSLSTLWLGWSVFKNWNHLWANSIPKRMNQSGPKFEHLSNCHYLEVGGWRVLGREMASLHSTQWKPLQGLICQKLLLPIFPPDTSVKLLLRGTFPSRLLHLNHSWSQGLSGSWDSPGPTGAEMSFGSQDTGYYLWLYRKT
jgi:hypothetical protein